MTALVTSDLIEHSPGTIRRLWSFRMSDKPPEDFRQLVAEVFPVGASGRLARSLDVSTRIAQRWIAGDVEPPERAWEFLQEQWQIVRWVDPVDAVHSLLIAWQNEPGNRAHKEVIGSHIAMIYEHVMGRPIE
jgi:hypothetical protein